MIRYLSILSASRIIDIIPKPEAVTSTEILEML